MHVIWEGESSSFLYIHQALSSFSGMCVVCVCVCVCVFLNGVLYPLPIQYSVNNIDHIIWLYFQWVYNLLGFPNKKNSCLQLALVC